LVFLMSFHCVACIKPLALDSLFCFLIYVYIPISIFGQFIQQHPFVCFSYFMLSSLSHFSNIMLLLMEVQITNLRAHLLNNTFYAKLLCIEKFQSKVWLPNKVDGYDLFSQMNMHISLTIFLIQIIFWTILA
jgi:hypothetical protein